MVFDDGWTLSIAVRRANETTSHNNERFAKLKVFEPRRESVTLRLARSSFCIENLEQADAWRLLNTHCAAGLTANRVFGRVDFKGSAAREVSGLSLSVDWSPERHVDIVGWSEEDSARLSQAQELRSKCEVVRVQ